MSKIVDYEKDFYNWALYNAQLLREGKFSDLDVEHLIEELEDMGNNRQELASRFMVLIGHLLKWEYQPHHRSSSWEGSINEQRLQINWLIQDKPSLKPNLSPAITKAYPKAVKLAAKDTKLPQTQFPQECPYTIEQLLDEDFYPAPKHCGDF
jgi:hypothetical protein